MTNNKLQAKAISKYIRLSPHKSRRVLEQIKGKNYSEARLLLEFMPYRACKVITKTLESAFSNIAQKTNKNINKTELIIIEAFANKGPTLKRFQPRAQGRAFPIQKPTCHITIKLEI
uniref:Large ribosomal subunit protein uL22c n=1 Tax=Ophidocladus simpliciusculus TaxID=1261574 RepID=A0A1Z1MJB2_9FLOR|nr:ribosomal protein L22 [Ophidocladus simpliciusculus]ARW66036.1 ribosomal protein L22 [Ophidocladus simpliciusculus]